jgi:glycosyltransferase involved in cell wall biosynthesis
MQQLIEGQTPTKNTATIEDLLEIFLVTCNRASYFDKALRQLKDSPFVNCRFTVLDNSSSDNTFDIAESYSKYFTNYRVIRHPRNIGGDYNFLRAIELSTYFYTWILCDDDDYDFTYADNIIDIVKSCKYELIYVASRSSVQLGWNGFGESTVKQLIDSGARYHRACTFWPALIFRAESYTNFCYQNAPYLFPSMKFLNRSIEFDFLIYMAEHAIVIRRDACTSEQQPLHLYKEWVTNASLIQDRKLRAYVIDQWTDRGFFKSLAFWIAVDRSKRVAGYWKRLVDILFALTPLQKIKFLMLLPIMIIPIPMPLLIRAREFVYRLMGHKDVNNLPPVETEQR